MKLSELAALPKGQLRIIDKTKELHYPAKWTDIVHVLYKDKHRAVRRYNGFLVGLCDGSKDPFPDVPNRGGLRMNCGRKAIDPKLKKMPVIIRVEQNVIDSFGGLKVMQKMLINYLKSQI